MGSRLFNDAYFFGEDDDQMINIDNLTKQVAAAKQQDRDAFASLFDETKDYTYSIACSLTQDTQEAQDIVQEVYLRVWLHLSDLQEERSFLRWLHSITFNITQDHLRRKIQQQNALDSAAETLVLQKTSFDEWFLRTWKKETIGDMVQALPEKQKEAVYLFYFLDRTVGEIAAIQNCSVNTVKSRLFYARNTLQKLIEEEENRTGRLHLSPAVIAMTAMMLLPMTPFQLPQAEALRILSAVFAAADSMNGGIAFAQVYDECEQPVRRGFVHRLLSSIEKHWIIRIRSSTVAVFLAAAVLLASGLILFGRFWERQTAFSEAGTQSDALTSVQTAPVTELQQSVPAVLAQGTLGGSIQYTVSDHGVLRISGEGRVGFQETWRWHELLNGEDQSLFSKEPLMPYRDMITSVVIEEGITEIGYAAFSRSPNLKTVSLPDSCTVIGAGAFFECASLTEFVFPPHVTELEDCVLRDCISLETIVVSEDARYIGSEAFSGCVQLANVEFRGNALTTIGSSAFCYLPSLKTLTLPASVQWIMSGVFRESGLEVLDLSNVKHAVIDSHAIWDCSELKTLLLPQQMNVIKTATVYNCSNLSSVILGENTVSIEKKAFHNAPLAEITIPASVTKIAAGAFVGNDALTTIWVDDANPFYCDTDGVLFNRAMDTIHTYPRNRGGASYVLPASVNVIASMAFAYNTELATLVVPGALQILEKQALYNLPALNRLYFQSAVPVIWMEDAITACDGLMLYYREPEDRMTATLWTAPDGTVYRTEYWNSSEQ